MPNYTKNIVRASKTVLDFLMGDQVQVDFSNVIKPEYLDSADCRRDTWGTSSNAYETEFKNGDLHFTTSWSPPLSVIFRLSEIFPDEEIKFAFADEGSWDNYLVCEIKNTLITKSLIFQEDTPDGYNLWCLIYWGQTGRAHAREVELPDLGDFLDDSYDVFSRLKPISRTERGIHEFYR